MDFSQISALALKVRHQYAEIEKKKYGKSWTTEQLALGFVGDVGELAKLIQAKTGNRAGDDLDAKLSHELADCLWSIIVLADASNIDLEQAFVKTMSGLQKRDQILTEN